MDINPTYANIRYPDGRVSVRDLAHFPKNVMLIMWSRALSLTLMNCLQCIAEKSLCHLIPHVKRKKLVCH